MKIRDTFLFTLIPILFVACNKVQDVPPSVYQNMTYHIYSTTKIYTQAGYAPYYDTIAENYDLKIKFCTDSLIWSDSLLYIRDYGSIPITYSHFPYPVSIIFSDNVNELEYRIDQGANTRNHYVTRIWGHKL